MLQVERSVYEEWIKTHKKAKGLYGVSFPFYDLLAEVYGKDKATGEGSESFARVVQNMDARVTESFTIDSDEDFEDDNESGASLLHMQVLLLMAICFKSSSFSFHMEYNSYIAVICIFFFY